MRLAMCVDGYDELGRREPLMGRLQAARPGLRPPLFHSAYEAVAWSILSARRPHAQGARLRDQLAGRHGRTFDLDGVRLAAFPTPQQLLEVTEPPRVCPRWR
jgi:DNA-3-methyladenine glycosylase II